MTEMTRRLPSGVLDLRSTPMHRLSMTALEAYVDQASNGAVSAPDDSVATLSALHAEAIRRSALDLAGRCDYAAARCAVSLGQLDDALSLIERARSEFLEAECPVDAARTDLGRMHVLDDLGRHDDAIVVGRDLLDRVRGLQLQADDPVDVHRLEAAANENLGVSHGYVGHHREALAAYQIAEARYAELGLHEDSTRCCANRGVEQVELGLLDEALEGLTDCRRQFLDSGERLSAALCAAYEATAHLQRGDYLEALRGTAFADELLVGHETTTEFARVQLVRARTLASLNLVDDALELYTSLEARFAVAGLSHDQATAIVNKAMLLLRSGRTTDAIREFATARSLFEEVGDIAMQAVAGVGLSYDHNADDATALAEQAVETLATLGRLPDEGAALLRLVELSPPDVGDTLLERCEQLVESADLPHLEWQVLRERARSRRRANDTDGARAALERAATVVEGLRLTVADERGRIPFLGTRRGVKEDRIDLMLDTGDVWGAYELSVGARARTLSERTEVEAHFVPPPTTGEVELTYEILGDEVVVFVRRDDGLKVIRSLTSASTVHRLVARLDAHWRRCADPGLVARHERALVSSVIDVMQRLHLELVAKIHELVEASLVTIVPVGPLTNVPFAALHDGSHHLIERAPIALAANIPVAVNAAAARRTANRTLLVGIADEQIPRVAEEVNAVAAWRSGSTILAEEAATIDAVSAAAAEHDIVHIACHGVNRRDNPELSALRLADGPLTAIEIGELDLSGRLIVLSACSSGRQHSIGNADEVVGLPRAFLAAGASDVVVNLWQVDDHAALELMTDFHTRLERHTPATALRDAQLALLERRPHPYLWAPTVVYAGLRRCAPAPQKGNSS